MNAREHAQLLSLEQVALGEHEAEGVLGERLFVLREGERRLRPAPLFRRENFALREAVVAHFVPFSRKRIRKTQQPAAYGEEQGAVLCPELRVCLPDIFVSRGVFHAHDLRAALGDAHGERAVFEFDHKKDLRTGKFFEGRLCPAAPSAPGKKPQKSFDLQNKYL